MCQECVSYLFFISQGVKTQLNHTLCWSGLKHFLFHLQLFWSKPSHAFWRVTFYWMGTEIDVLEKGCHLDNPCMYISQVPANGFVSSQSIEHSKRNLRKVVILTTIWCPKTLNHHNSMTGCWDWCSSRKGCNIDDNSWITNIILNTYFQIQHDSLKSTAW